MRSPPSSGRELKDRQQEAAHERRRPLTAGRADVVGQFQRLARLRRLGDDRLDGLLAAVLEFLPQDGEAALEDASVGRSLLRVLLHQLADGLVDLARQLGHDGARRVEQAVAVLV